MLITLTIKNALYLLALLNPASKIMFLSTYEPRLSRQHVFELAWKSSLAALIILISLAGVGEWVLSQVFRIEFYSLRITGGLVVFFIGWIAIREGRFTEKKLHGITEDYNELSLVPLAAPLIAGPGTIAASIACTAQCGLLSTSCSLLIAMFVNFILMCFSAAINKMLVKTHLQGPLIRLTGLIIAATAMQMILTGLHECFFKSQPSHIVPKTQITSRESLSGMGRPLCDGSFR